MKCADIREHFHNELAAGRTVSDRSGGKTIELIGASFEADEPSIFGKVDQEYVMRELQWYASQICNINELGKSGKIPAAWKATADQDGWINSNYGFLIWSEKYHTQYLNVLDELRKNPDSRRAAMIYTRPSIWNEYNENGRNDFICTNAVTYYIRDGQCHCVVQMRSNDVVFGYKNDRAWQHHVLEQLASDLGKEPGKIHWQVQNLHVYDRHFHLITKENNDL